MSLADAVSCMACDLTSGKRPLPGGVIHRSPHWAVEHCIGPLGVGTLIVKPLRHVTLFADLTPNETADFGPLLHSVTQALMAELSPDQTYITEWSHAGWEPGHIHFVVQPAWNSQRERFARPGPFMQTDMFAASILPNADEVAAFCNRMRARFASNPPTVANQSSVAGPSSVARAFQPRKKRAVQQ